MTVEGIAAFSRRYFLGAQLPSRISHFEVSAGDEKPDDEDHFLNEDARLKWIVESIDFRRPLHVNPTYTP